GGLGLGTSGEQLGGEVLCGAVRFVVHHAYTVSDRLTAWQARILVTWDTGLRGSGHTGDGGVLHGLELLQHELPTAGVVRVVLGNVPGGIGGQEEPVPRVVLLESNSQRIVRA